MAEPLRQHDQDEKVHFLIPRGLYLKLKAHALSKGFSAGVYMRVLISSLPEPSPTEMDEAVRSLRRKNRKKKLSDLVP